MEERWEKIEDNMETIKGDINEMMRLMKTIMHQAIVKLQEDIQEVKNDQKETKATMVAEVLPELQSEKAAVIIQAFLRTTAVRVKLDRAKYLWGTQRAHIYWVFNPFRLG